MLGKSKVYSIIANNKKKFAWLLDPDKFEPRKIEQCLKDASLCPPDLIMVGGSLLHNNRMDECVSLLKENSDIPLVLFPGNTMQIHKRADAILFLSLISGRNPDYLIGRHVEVSVILKNSNIEVIPSGYMLIDTGRPTSAAYISNTRAIPHDKPDLAISTAVAGELLGLRTIFLDGGSGAENIVSSRMLEEVKRNISLPLLTGGGISNSTQMKEAFQCGADVVVVGNAIEKDPALLYKFAETAKSF
jgi:phosphoglycerol geranylgeranyltransferase